MDPCAQVRGPDPDAGEFCILHKVKLFITELRAAGSGSRFPRGANIVRSDIGGPHFLSIDVAVPQLGVGNLTTKTR